MEWCGELNARDVIVANSQRVTTSVWPRLLYEPDRSTNECDIFRSRLPPGAEKFDEGGYAVGVGLPEMQRHIRVWNQEGILSTMHYCRRY